MMLSKQNHLTLEEAERIQRIYIDEYGDIVEDNKYPSSDLYPVRLQDIDLVNRIDNRLKGHILPTASGFNTFHEMINNLNLAALYIKELTPNNILEFASKISHLDKITQECLYDNINIVMGIMDYTPIAHTHAECIDLVLKRFFIAEVYYKHCGYKSIKINNTPRINKDIRKYVKELLVKNDRFLGVAR